MQRHAFVLRIKRDRVDEYVEAHEEVWPELRQALSDAGVRNYSIHLYDNLAFGYLEANDVDEALAKVGRTDVNARWQDRMSEYLEQRVAEEGPEGLPEIFRLD